MNLLIALSQPSASGQMTVANHELFIKEEMVRRATPGKGASMTYPAVYHDNQISLQQSILPL